MQILILGAFFIASLFGSYSAVTPEVQDDPMVGAALPGAVAVFETSLASPITSSATSMTLTANSVRGGGTLSGYQCLTIDEGSAQAEYVCGTVSGTSVTSMSRGVSPSTGTTTVAALQFAHRRGANVKITDFPVLQILKAQLNGEDTIPNLIYYTSGTACTGASLSTTLCSKAYVDAIAVAGASDANDSVKGIVEMATGAEAQAGATYGSTGARLTLGANLATSTRTLAGIYIPVTGSNGILSISFMPTTTAWTFGNFVTFASTTFMQQSSSTMASIYTTLYVGGSATSTIQGNTTGTSTLQGFLNVSGANSTSTFSGAASTTNLQVAGACIGCSWQYTGSSTAFSVSTGSVVYTGSIPRWANNAIVNFSGGGACKFSQTSQFTREGLTSVGHTYATPGACSGTDGVSYTFTWGGNDFTVAEGGDTNTNNSVSGTAYWYK